MGPLAAIGIGLGGAALGGLGSFLGGSDKPDIPAFPKVKFDELETQRMRKIEQELPKATAISAQASKANAEQIKAMMELAVPGSTGVAASNIADLMRGQLPREVEQSILRSGAANALAKGFAGTGFQATSTMLAMRGKALEAMQLGHGLHAQYTAPFLQNMVSPMSMFYSPEQRAQMEMWYAEQKFNRNVMAAGAAAMPSRTEQAFGGMLSGLGGAAMTVGMAGAMGAFKPAPAAAGGMGSFTPTSTGAAWSTGPAYSVGTPTSAMAGAWR